MLAVMGANLEPDAAYPWAVDGIVRMRNRITAELAHSNNPGLCNYSCSFSTCWGNQPHIPLADLTSIQVPTLVMAGDRDVIRDEHTLSMFHALPKSQLAIFPAQRTRFPHKTRHALIERYSTSLTSLLRCGYKGPRVVD